MESYLTGDVRALFDAWHASLRERFERDLTFAEIRKGVQALSSLYVGRRSRLAGGGDPLEGAGKRAAFCLFYAPLHFLVTWHVAREIEFNAISIARLWDLGCGTGAAGAAWGVAARSAGAAWHEDETERVVRDDGRPRRPSPRIIGVDRSGFAIQEAEETYRAFGLRGETRRIDLGERGERIDVVRIGSAERGGGGGHDVARSGSSARGRHAGRRAGGEREIPLSSLPAEAAAPARRGRGSASGAAGPRKDDAVLLAYTVNEIGEAARESLLRDLAAGSGTSRPLLIIEPIAKRAAPWWPHWEHALGEEALLLHSFEWRRRIVLPEWIAGMDHAAGLDHSELTARVMGMVG